MLFMRFTFCLAFGLFGLAIVLKTLIDVMFTDWDLFAEMKVWLKDVSKRKEPEYELFDDGMMHKPRLATRVQAGRAKPTVAEEFLAPSEELPDFHELFPRPDHPSYALPKASTALETKEEFVLPS